MSETSKAIHDLTKLIGHYHIQEVKLSTERCDYYLTHLLAIVAERDEARREYCKARYREERADLRSTPTSPEEIAEDRGWDCFDAKEAKQ